MSLDGVTCRQILQVGIKVLPRGPLAHLDMVCVPADSCLRMHDKGALAEGLRFPTIRACLGLTTTLGTVFRGLPCPHVVLTDLIHLLLLCTVAL